MTYNDQYAKPNQIKPNPNWFSYSFDTAIHTIRYISKL